MGFDVHLNLHRVSRLAFVRIYRVMYSVQPTYDEVYGSVCSYLVCRASVISGSVYQDLDQYSVDATRRYRSIVISKQSIAVQL